MRGRYHMMDWELEKWKQELSVVIARLTWDKQHKENFTHLDICPANIEKSLEEMGWETEEQEENGWENDCWIYFTNEDYDFGLTLYYQGYTFELKLYRSDIDD
jgi:hypothetical protein